jgi:hypothetical protein
VGEQKEQKNGHWETENVSVGLFMQDHLQLMMAALKV